MHTLHDQTPQDGLPPTHSAPGSDKGSEADGGHRPEALAHPHKQEDTPPHARPPLPPQPPQPQPPSSFLDVYLSNLLQDEKPAAPKPQQASVRMCCYVCGVGRGMHVSV